MKTKFCLPVIKETIEDVQKAIEQYRSEYDMFEVWVDYICEPNPMIFSLVEDLSTKFGNRLIVVFRRKKGEAIHMSFENRMEIIKRLSQTKTFVDLDIEKQKQDLEEIDKQKIKANIIASFHDFEKTPRTSALVKIIKGMDVFHPAIYKIATFCQSQKKAVSLLHLLLDLKEQKKKCIILGMGKHGTITRIFGSLWGNEMIFAPVDVSQQSAPGQLTKRQLEQIFAIVEEDYAG